MLSFISFIFLSVFYLTLCGGDASFNQDTYINALQTSHQTDSESNSEFGGYDYSPAPNNQYLPPPTKAPIYGPPAQVYRPLAPVYGPPSPTFYKPLPLGYHSRDHFSLLEKIKTKINLFTIGKIILKLLIFKKIVKFIGLIFLLLFLPKLKDMFKEDMSMDDHGLESKQVETEQDKLENRINNIYNFVEQAFVKFKENVNA